MKKKNNWFKNILIGSFIVFMGLLIARESGFYEAKLNNEVILTDKALKDFEEDILNGEVVDLNTYINHDNNDYSNSFTRAGDKISEAVIKVLSEGITGFWDALKVLFFWIV